MPNARFKSIGAALPVRMEIGRQMVIGVRQFCETRQNVQVELWSLTENPSDKILPRIENGPAVLFSPPTHFTREQKEFCQGKAVFTSNRDEDTPEPKVINDDFAVGRIAADYLQRCGYRCFAFLGHPGHVYSSERQASFEACLREAGFPCRIFELEPDEPHQHLWEALQESKDPVGVFAANDGLARSFLHLSPDPSRDFPQRFGVLGVDDDPVFNAVSPVALSSIRLSGERIGFEAARAALHLFQGRKPGSSVLRIPPISVIPRASTDFMATEDPLCRRILTGMRQDPARFQDVKHIVEEFGLSRRTLENRYRKATGRTIAADLNFLRLQRAKDLIRNTELTFSQIANVVGFSEPRLLWHAFKRFDKETPSAYRKRIRLNQPLEIPD